MAERTIHEQLVKYLTDVHSIEEQALTQLRQAPKIAGHPRLAELFTEHATETEDHERLVRARLEAIGESPTALKDLPARALGQGFILFARFQPDTPGKLTAHAYSYEGMEDAAYRLLRLFAERAGDEETVEIARTIGEQEQAMADRLAASFDEATEASLEAVEPDDLGEQLDKYLADAHAVEAQAIELLEKGPKIAGDEALQQAYVDHLEETREQQRQIRERLEARGASPSTLKDAGLRTGALNWGGFFAAQPDTPAKLAAFAYAFEHLEIAGYEQLRRVAERAGDRDTAAAVGQILGQERSAAERIASLFDRAADASLEAVGAGR